MLCAGQVSDCSPRQKSTQKMSAGHVDLMRSFPRLFWEFLLLGASEKPIRGHVEAIGDAADISKREALGLKLLSDCSSSDVEFTGEVCSANSVLFHLSSYSL